MSNLPAYLTGTAAAGEAFAAAITNLIEIQLPALPEPPVDTVINSESLQCALRGEVDIVGVAADSALLHALFRDYAITASAYLLEPKQRGLPVRTRLPPQIAKPLWTLAHALGLPPFLEYTAYCLGNCTLRDGVVNANGQANARTSNIDWYSQRLIRQLKGGPEESTFVIVHAEIESHTPAMLRIYADVLAALDTATSTSGPLAEPLAEPLTRALVELHGVVSQILASQLKMFNACDPRGYVGLVRPWIFGTRGNPDFTGGAITFEGVADAARASKWTLDASPADAPEPWVTASLRGETGAQSTIIPSLDALLGVTHAFDALRVMLAEIEHYRPTAHRQLLRSLRMRMWGDANGSHADAAVALGIEKRGLSAPPPQQADAGCPYATAPNATTITPTNVHALKDALRSLGDRSAIRAYNALVEQVHAFRDIHMSFAELYITRFTDREWGTSPSAKREA